MRTRILLLLLVSGIVSGAIGQNSIDLTFTAVDNEAYVQSDSIKVMNRTQGSENMIYWPDTTLSLQISQGDTLLCVGYATFSTTAVSEVNDEISSFEVYQNYPNPMEERSEISIYIPQTGKLHVMITDLQGKIVLRHDWQLHEGFHSFRFHPGGGNLYFLTANWNGLSRSIQMISTGQQYGKNCRLDYIGGNIGGTVLKASSEVNDFVVRQSGILDTPEESIVYTFQFATNIPCPGAPTVEYEGQVYNTIQIFSQCWLKENLNVGTMLNSSLEQTNNGIIEKYCYNNEPDSCTIYGGLYQWNEMMQYTTQQGTQGICPPGWHLPADEEWKVLEGSVDSQYGIGNPEWEIWAYRGYDAGTNLKAIKGWYGNGSGTDLFGFSGRPGGGRFFGGEFIYGGMSGGWWTSTVSYEDIAWTHGLDYSNTGAGRLNYTKENGFSVRCLRD